MKIQIKALSSLEKVFSDCEPDSKGISALSLLSNERTSVQFAFMCDENAEAAISIKSGLNTQAYLVKMIYAGRALAPDAQDKSFFLHNAESGLYPDLLDELPPSINAEKGCWYSVWIELLPEGVHGEFNVEFTVSAGKEKSSADVKVKAIDMALPPQKLIHINWFHSDCLASIYGVEVFSEEYWRITESFVKNAAGHGVNCLLTPVFTPPLDTAVGGERPTVQLVDVVKKGYTYTFGFEKLDRWIAMAQRSGIEYFEISHLFTQWGANNAPKIMAQTSAGYKKIFGWDTKADSQGYRSFLRQFGAALTEYTDSRGITDSCFVHASDEPWMDCITSYKKAAAIVHEYFGRYKHIDALSDFEFYSAGLIETPIPGEQEIESFKGKVPQLWTYYCCGQWDNNLPNRFFCMPSIRNRILGVLLYKYNCVGFLQWGFNFYYTRYSLRTVDPFTETDAGGSFPSGDSYVVYPGKNGMPLSSLRQKVFYDAFEDIRALELLESLTSRNEVLGLIESALGSISFTSYPHDPDLLLAFREDINKKLAECNK